MQPATGVSVFQTACYDMEPERLEAAFQLGPYLLGTRREYRRRSLCRAAIVGTWVLISDERFFVVRPIAGRGPLIQPRRGR